MPYFGKKFAEVKKNEHFDLKFLFFLVSRKYWCNHQWREERL